MSEIGSLLRDISGASKAAAQNIGGASKAAVISDANVFALYGERVVTSLQGAGYETCSFAFPAGEQSKNFETLESVLNFLAESGVQRSDVVLALGGGVVGDVAGFAASVYMRGIDYVQVPTTLLAMVDSSVGGKTAIDLEKGKNLAGAFWQPLAVFCDLDTLDTLPPEVFAEGMGEVIKTNAIAGLGFHEAIAGLDSCEVVFNSDSTDLITDSDSSDILAAGESIEKIITACIEYKSKIVSADELDNKGVRAILNAGHTIGHCIEKLSDYAIPHGKAVANGLLIEAALAVELGLCDSAFLESLKSEVAACGLLMDGGAGATEMSVRDGGAGEEALVESRFGEDSTARDEAFNPDSWIEIMALDKKNAGDEIAFILPEGAGKYVMKKLKAEELKKLLKKETLKPLLQMEKSHCWNVKSKILPEK